MNVLNVMLILDSSVKWFLNEFSTDALLLHSGLQKKTSPACFITQLIT